MGKTGLFLRSIVVAPFLLPLPCLALNDDPSMRLATSFANEAEQHQFQQAVSAMVNQDNAGAKTLLQPLAEKNHAEAQSALGMLLLQSSDVNEAQQGLSWVYRAAREGVWRAQARLATAYTNGEYVEKNLITARYWMLQALAGGGSQVLRDLSQLNQQTLQAADQAMRDGNTQLMQALLLAAAESGVADAQYRLAEAYETGVLQPLDDKGGNYWLELAAEQNIPAAQLKMALKLIDQQVVSQADRVRAVSFLQRAAGPGDRDAQYKLGQLYSAKWLPEADNGKADYWYRLAAEQGHQNAQYQLGVNYTVSEEKDSIESFRWFRMAAKQGNDRAKYNVGVMYLNGRGVPQDVEQGKKWLSLAAQSGHPKAGALLANAGNLTSSRVDTPQPAALPAIQYVAESMQGGEWFSSLPANGYTVQLITARQPSSIKDFVHQLGLGQEQLFVYRLNRKRALHVAQYGFYPTEALANRAAARLAKKYKGFEPVVRRVGQIQAKLKQEMKG